MLTRDQITNYKAKTQTLKTAQGEVMIREMTSGEYFEYLAAQTASVKDDGTATIDAGLIAKVTLWCLLNPDGTQMFQADEADEVNKIEPGTMFKIYIAAASMSGISIEAVTAAKKG